MPSMNRVVGRSVLEGEYDDRKVRASGSDPQLFDRGRTSAVDKVLDGLDLGGRRIVLQLGQPLAGLRRSDYVWRRESVEKKAERRLPRFDSARALEGEIVETGNRTIYVGQRP